MLFLIKDDELFEKYNKIWKKSGIASEKDLVVNLYAINNILKLK